MLGALVALLIFAGGAFVLVIGFVGAIAAMGGCSLRSVYNHRIDKAGQRRHQADQQNVHLGFLLGEKKAPLCGAFLMSRIPPCGGCAILSPQTLVSHVFEHIALSQRNVGHERGRTHW